MRTTKLHLTAAVLSVAGSMCLATQETSPEPSFPSEKSHANPEADVMPASASETKVSVSRPIAPQVAGPVISAGTQPLGALTGRVIYMSGGHGWQTSGSTWTLQRPLLLEMNEDTGNVDQMTLFAYYCFNAGATVVPFRPIGDQTNEVVIDNDDPQVTWSGAWANSFSSVYFGSASDTVPYRFSDTAASETATATYTPNLPTSDFYPVYCWALGGTNRTNQLYRINHTGGQSLVRVPHHLVGGGWVYLGTYYFNMGSNSATGSVVISNLGENGGVGGVVIADAIRFGNGMGDVDEGGGVSRYPRADESNAYWVQRSLGQGQPTSIYANGGVSSPIRMAAEMNNEGSGNMYKRAYVGFHSNATTGNPSTATARGVCGLWNNTALPNVETNSATPNQYDYALTLATEVKNDMTSISSPPLETSWGQTSGLTYANPSFAYGEINNNRINNEFDATIVEVAFHDNTKDSLLLRDPKARNWIARAVCQGMVRYMNKYDGLTLNFIPEPPYDVRAESLGYGIRITWAPPVIQGGSGTPAGYIVYRSTNGYGFGSPVTVAGAGATSLVISNVAAGTDCYFRVAAYNPGGESMPSETVGCRIPGSSLSSRILIVNGFTRFHRTLNMRQNLAAENYKPAGHDGNTGAIERVWPRRVNSFDYVVAHGKAIASVSLMGFDSCQVRAVTNGVVNLTNYDIVVWQAGNQSTNDRTFTVGAQQRIAAFRATGGHLFVSGADVAFDLGRQSASVADRQFLTNHLHAALVSDAHNNSGSHTFVAGAGSIFAGNGSGEFDDGGKGIYWVGSPDALTPAGNGTTAVLSYPGFPGAAAGIRYDGRSGDGKVVLFGFPFETITSPALRSAYMADILQDFSRPSQFTGFNFSGPTAELTVTAEPGLTYQLESSTNLTDWMTGMSLVNTNGTMSFADSNGGSTRYYRVRTATP